MSDFELESEVESKLKYDLEKTNMKIGMLIPSTSFNRQWNDYTDTYLYKYTLISFLTTYDSEHEYIFYIGIDKNDPVYDKEITMNKFIRFISVMKNVSIEFIYLTNVKKGHLTVMWNQLFQKAYDDDCDYFFQCGDDIRFDTSGWVNSCISTLKKHNNIGMTGPINNNTQILTQSFVSRTHMILFEYYFPPQIINWCCDDWINHVYRKINNFYPLMNHYCSNEGGTPRYTINNDSTFNNKSDFKTNIVKLREECLIQVDHDLQRLAGKLKMIE